MESLTQKTKEELLQLLINNIEYTLKVIIIGGAFITYIFITPSNAPVLYAWLFVIVILSLYRYWLARNYSNLLKRFSFDNLRTKIIFTTILTAIIFSLGCSYLFNTIDSIERYLLIIVQIGFVSGAIMNLSYYKKTVITYVVILFIPLFYFSLDGVEEHSVWLFASLLIYFFLSIAFILKYNNYIINLFIESKKIKELAFYDQLTGLANRNTFNQELLIHLDKLKTNNTHSSIFFIDIDNFKDINDTLGHNIGDELLQSFAQRINTIININDIFARFGGDEFIILFSKEFKTETDALNYSKVMSDTIHKLVNSPFKLLDYSLNISLSIGITTVDKTNKNHEDIIQHSDIAMYHAKKNGKKQSSFFEYHMKEKVSDELVLNNELYKALKEKQFEIYFQPICNIYNNVIESCEVLVRWNHPSKGLLYPKDFIEYSEQNNFLGELGNEVLRQTFKQYNKWNKLQNMSIKTIAINISPKQFNKINFVENIMCLVKEFDVNPEDFKLELTEAVVINNIDEIVVKMKKLQKLGFKFSMDDFGTGYSSLSYLQNLPFNSLKIDMQFIKNVVINQNDANLVKTIVSISKQFGFSIIAEGVTSIEQLEFLKKLECDYYQGFYISEALESNMFEKLVSTSV